MCSSVHGIMSKLTEFVFESEIKTIKCQMIIMNGKKKMNYNSECFHSFTAIFDPIGAQTFDLPHSRQA
jgi:hypothetical protein